MSNVAIKLSTALDEQGQWEYHTVKASGDFYRRNAMDVLMFQEETEAGPVRNMLTIQPEKVSIKRSGALSMHQQFEIHRLTENSLRHPYITVHMQTYTDSIQYDADEGHLTIIYTVNLNGQGPRQQQLELSIKQADEA